MWHISLYTIYPLLWSSVIHPFCTWKIPISVPLHLIGPAPSAITWSRKGNRTRYYLWNIMASHWCDILSYTLYTLSCGAQWSTHSALLSQDLCPPTSGKSGGTYWAGWHVLDLMNWEGFFDSLSDRITGMLGIKYKSSTSYISGVPSHLPHISQHFTPINTTSVWSFLKRVTKGMSVYFCVCLFAGMLLLISWAWQVCVRGGCSLACFFWFLFHPSSCQTQ